MCCDFLGNMSTVHQLLNQVNEGEAAIPGNSGLDGMVDVTSENLGGFVGCFFGDFLGMRYPTQLRIN